MIEITTWFTLGAVGMLLGSVAFVWRAISTDRASLRYDLTLVGISLIAAIAYALMAVGYGWLEVGDRLVFAPRYVDWILTTPLLLAFLGMLADVDRSLLWKVIGVNTLVMVAGFVAAVLPGTERFAVVAVGGLAYVGLVALVVGPMTARANERDSGTASLFTSLRNLTIILWSVYPVIWLLGPPGLGLLTPGVDVMLITYLDLLTKVGFGLIALNASAAIDGASETAAIGADVDHTS